jgi:hypothetical protein
MTNLVALTEDNLAARCHEIQIGLSQLEVPHFDTLPFIGMCVRLALHLQGLPPIPYEQVRIVASCYLDIPPTSVKRVVMALADIEFVRLAKSGSTITTVVPDIPYYVGLYKRIGEFAKVEGFNELENLTLDVVQRLAIAPQNLDTIRNQTNAENAALKTVFSIGEQGGYARIMRARGKDIAISPTYFSENAENFAQAVAKVGATSVQEVLGALQRHQGIPLSEVTRTSELAGKKLSSDQVVLLQALAGEGAIRPPSICTSHSGENFFLFTPTPNGGAMSPTKRPIFEKAMALVSSVRQGQYLAKEYRIRSPYALISAFADKKYLNPNSEAMEQYRNVVHMGVAKLSRNTSNGRATLQLIDTTENNEALAMAKALVASGAVSGLEVNDEAKFALEKDQTYAESIVAANTLRTKKRVPLSQELQEQLELALGA